MTPIKTFWFVGSNGFRYHTQGNSMHDPSKPTPDYKTLEEATTACGLMNSYLEPKYRDLKVYRCDISEEKE